MKGNITQNIFEARRAPVLSETQALRFPVGNKNDTFSAKTSNTSNIVRADSQILWSKSPGSGDLTQPYDLPRRAGEGVDTYGHMM